MKQEVGVPGTSTGENLSKIRVVGATKMDENQNRNLDETANINKGEIP